MNSLRVRATGVLWGLGLAVFGALALCVWGVVPVGAALALSSVMPAAAPYTVLLAVLAPVLWAATLVGFGYWAWRGIKQVSPGWLGAPLAFWAGLGMVLLTRVAAVVLFDAPLVSDFQEYRDLALSVTQGGAWFSDLRPMGYPLLLAPFYALFGPQTWVGEALNVGFAVATGALLHRVVVGPWGPVAANLALWLFALCPAQILFTPVLGTELAYGAVLLGAMLLVLGGDRRWWLAALAGVALAGSQYLRATSLALLPAWLALPAIAGWPRRAWLGAIACGVLFVATLAPVALWNHQQDGKWSLSTSQYGGWSLLVGTNTKHNGVWNGDDAALMAAYPPVRPRDAEARKLAMTRLQADPAGVVALAVRKFPAMWAVEDYGAYWVFGTRPGATVGLAVGTALSQVFYGFLVVLAVLGLWADRKRRPAAGLLIISTMGILVVLHSVMEIQSRYHAYMVPLFCALAAVGLAKALGSGEWSERVVAESVQPVESPSNL